MKEVSDGEDSVLSINYIYLYSYGWFILAIISIAISGIISILLTFPRTLGAPLSDKLFKSLLVGHTLFSLIIWIISFSMVVIYLNTGSFNKNISRYLANIGLYFSYLSILFIILAIIVFPGNPLTVDYLPVIENHVFFMGLSFFFLSIMLTAISFLYEFLYRDVRSITDILLAVYCLSLIISILSIPLNYIFIGNVGYEELFWGFGHILQLANIVILIVIYANILDFLGINIISNSKLGMYSILYVTSIFSTLFFVNLPINLYIEYYTIAKMLLMIVVIPIIIVIMIKGIGNLYKLGVSYYSHPIFLSITASILLLFLGGVLGIYAYLKGGLNITAHYHASLNSLTMAYMGYTYYMMNKIDRKTNYKSHNRKKLQIVLYFVGVLLMIISLLLAAGYSAPRKTYSGFTTLPLYVLILFGFGGILLIIGGIIYLLESVLWLNRILKLIS